MKRYLSIAMVMVAAGSLLLSCSSSSHAFKQKVWVDMMSEKRPIQLTEQQRVFVNDNNAFTLNFLKAVSEADHSGKSFIFSPLSVTYVLSMVNAAADGATEQELEQSLGFHEGGIQAVNEYCKNLIDNLPKVDEKVELNIANAIFLNKTYELKEQFKKDMQEYYRADAEALDFSSTKTLNRINNWCNKKTNGMIPSILNNVEPEAISYLLNAIYFKADWKSKFNPDNTKDETFTTENGRREVPMMHQNVLINYVKNDTYAAIDIPYGNSLWCMTVMLPVEGKSTDDIISRLAETGWSVGQSNPMRGAIGHKVDLKLPRYETSSDTEDLEEGLKGLLQQLGIQRVFDSDCMDVLRMCDRPVYINMIRQKAMIKVNEKGTEAAAVTASGLLGGTAAIDVTPRATFHANRPFVYVIREVSSGVILFVGKFTGE